MYAPMMFEPGYFVGWGTLSLINAGLAKFQASAVLYH